MIPLKVSPAEARAEVGRIGHERCQQAAAQRFRTVEDAAGMVCATPPSVAWLFCWVATGLSSEAAAQDARRAFNAIFDLSYETLAGKLPLEAARALRYRAHGPRVEAAWRSLLA